jgi:amidohydrolase
MSSDLDRAEAELSSSSAELIEIRRSLHRRPELSGVEHETTAYIQERLAHLGIAQTPGPGGVGVLAQLPGDRRDRSIVALRADIDALPIKEENSVSYRSENDGVMHACGHDAHTAMLLGALSALRRTGSPIPCRGIFQSSEEAGQGALDMVHAGAVEGVSSIIALHVDPNLPVGVVGVTSGPQTAFCQDFSVLVRGRGGHAARPHLTIDPIAIGAQWVTALYQTIPRASDVAKPVVVTIGQFEGGHCSNVIPDTARLRGTVRTLDATSAEETRARIQHLCEGVALSSGAKIEVVFDRQLPGVVNDEKITRTCQQAARDVLGEDKVILLGHPSMGAEDFADYLSVVPGCMMRLGVARPDGFITPLHTPTFDIAEDALLIGSRLLLRCLHALTHAH